MRMFNPLHGQLKAPDAFIPPCIHLVSTKSKTVFDRYESILSGNSASISSQSLVYRTTNRLISDHVSQAGDADVLFFIKVGMLLGLWKYHDVPLPVCLATNVHVILCYVYALHMSNYCSEVSRV